MKTTCQQIPTDLCKYNDTDGENLFLQITDGCLDKIWNIISYICEQIRICILVLAILQVGGIFNLLIYNFFKLLFIILC